MNGAAPRGRLELSEVRVFYTSLARALSPDQALAIQDGLPATRRAAIERLRDLRDRDRSLIGERLLATAMRACGFADFDAGCVIRPFRGKPRWPGGPDFSLSHSGSIVALAVARQGRVGLDVERRRAVDWRSLRRVLTPQELARAAADPRLMLGLWTRKEAAIKAVGLPLTRMADVVLDEDSATIDGIELALAEVCMDADHVAHVAVTSRASSIDIVRMDVV